MKHILNDLSSDEKNRILEQYNGEKTIDVKNFKRLLESQLGNVKPLISEQTQKETPEVMKAKQFYLQKHGYTKGISGFKVDGVYGETTKKAIENFQKKLGVWPVDGIWGEETFKKMNPKQIGLYKQYVADYGGIIDKALHFIGLD
jgi:peptidoglycan hydrolase-like protein with peptidoglycan-binding domain